MPDGEVAFLIRHLFDDAPGESGWPASTGASTASRTSRGLGLLRKALERYRQIPVTFVPRRERQPLAV